MTKRTFLLAVAVGLGLCARAAILGPEQILPADTLAVISIPDWDKASAYFEASPYGRLWQDPALKPFKDHFLKQLKEDVVEPIERELGVKFADYAGLAHGQFTLAITLNGWDGKSDRKPGFVLLIDARDKAGQMKTHVSALKKKWIDAGKQIKTEPVRDIEFATLLVKPDDLGRTLEKVFPGKSSEREKTQTNKDSPPFEISIGQFDSLLLVGTSLKDLEKIIIRASGGTIPNLVEQPEFQASRSGLLRDALGFGWLTFKPIYEALSRYASDASAAQKPDSPFSFRPDKILAATGLAGLKTIAFKFSGSSDGSITEVHLGVPDSARQGIFKIISPERKNASPPAFVPGEAAKFIRWRVDGQKAWAALENIFNTISPEMAGMLQSTIALLGKEKDPNFDLKRNLIGNLGDDIISFQKTPQVASLADLSAPPSLVMIGSSNAEKLTDALKALAGILPTSAPNQGLSEREFLGRKIHSITLPSPPGAEPIKNDDKKMINFTASAGYVAVSGDAGMIEQFLRASDGRTKPLREAVGLIEAAEKVGGMETGLFGYENQSETMRATLEAFKNDSAKLQRLLSMTPLGKDAAENKKDPDNWFNFTLLPSFDKIAKYFHFIVYAGNATENGLEWKLFAPTPPQLR